jgi:RHS repeat-associated protein
MAMGVVGAPFELLDTGFALVTAPLAALMPGLPAATLTAPHFGTPHGHAHPPSLIPPNPVPIPLPSIGTVMCAGCVSVLIGGIPAARAGDVGLAVTCGSLSPAFEVYTGSSNTWIGGSRAARMTDITRHCNPASAMGKLGAIMGAVGLAAGGVSAGAASAGGEALQASMQAAQLAADAVALAMSALLGKDPGVPPALGALLVGNPTVLIGGFPLPDLLDVLGAALKGLKKLGDAAGKSPAVKKALAKVGLCNDPGEPVNSFSGVVYNDFEDYRDPNGFVWERHYRSDWNDDDGSLGYGFRHFYDRRLRLLRKRALYEAHDGEQVSIPRADGGGFVPGAGFTLTEQQSGRHVLTTDRDEVLEFDTRPTESPSARLVRYGRKDLQLSLTYDDRGRLKALTEVNGDRVIDTRIARDERGRIVQLRRGVRGGTETTISRYAYENDCLVAWQDALGATARMHYDAARRMVQGTDRRGYSFHWHYDPHTGRCIKAHGDDGLWGIEARYEGNQSVFKEADGGEWTFKHFPDGVVSHILDPEGGVLEYVRDEDTGRIVKQIMPGGTEYQWLYDARGKHYGRLGPFGHLLPPEDEDPRPPNPLGHDGPTTPKEVLYGRPMDGLADSLGGLPSVVKHRLDRVLTHTLPSAPPPTEPTRDAAGRVVEQIEPGGSVHRFKYDGEGNVSAELDSSGEWSSRHYTSWNLLDKQTSALGHVTRYEYTHRGKWRALVDPNGNRTEYVRDKRHRIHEIHRYGELYRRYLHDAFDTIIEEQDGCGNTLVKHETGPHGLHVSTTLASGERYTYEYDSQGQFTKASSTEHEIVQRHGGDLLELDLRDGRGVEHQYGPARRLRQTKYFERFRVRYEYPTDSRARITTPDGATHDLWHQQNILVRENGNGTTEASVFDAADRLAARACWRRALTVDGPHWTTSYRYNASSDLISSVDSAQGPAHYEYDADHRLVAQHDYRGEQRYSYDSGANLTSTARHQLIEYVEGNLIQHADFDHFEHDARRRRSKHDRLGGPVVHYSYDSQDQLIEVRWSDRAEVWNAAYDGLGRRLWREYGGDRTDFYWDGDRLAAERDPDGRVRLYVYANEDALVPFMWLDYASESADPESGKAFYLFAAPTGMPLRVEDAQGREVWHARAIDVYGEIDETSAAPCPTRLRFAGHFFDEHLGLFYNRFRDYDPALGRYLQPDPLGHAGGINLFAYAANPMVQVDLRGLIHKKANSSDADGTDGQNGNKKPAEVDPDAAKKKPTEVDPDAAKKKRSAEKEQQREARREQVLDQAIADANAPGKRGKPSKRDLLSKDDQDWLDQDPRHARLAVDPDGKGKYEIGEAKTGLAAEKAGQVKPPVKRAVRDADPSEAGADLVDGDSKKWDVKAARDEPKIAETANAGENVMVDCEGMDQAQVDALKTRLDNQLNPDAADVIYVRR